jgi:hypothetical protein
MTSRLILLGLLVLAAVAAADSFRSEPKDRIVSDGRTQGERLIGNPAPEYVAEGERMRTHVNRRGRLYLSAAEIDEAFPAPLEGLPFDVAHVAVAPDGTLALAVYKLPPTGPIRAAVELWRRGELLSAFNVPTGTFGGGLGFTSDGRFVATVTPDGTTAVLFSREGDRVGRIPVTSW